MLYKDNPNNLLNLFLEFLKRNQLLQNDTTTLLAISGGIDSVVMSSLFYHAQLKFAIAHCNFGLRGKASEEDEQFVYQLAQHYQVPYYTKRFDTQAYAQQKHLSIQMAARHLRYAWFEELRKQHALQWVATAHHQEDVLETLLLNLTKGTGIAGLHGILPKKGPIIRPLLFTDKKSLLQYAQGKKLTWREDASNTEDTYQRNLIRNQVIPVLKTINPNLIHTSQLTIERLAQVDLLFQEHLSLIKQKIYHTHTHTQEIHVSLIQRQPWASVVLWEMLKPFGFNFSQIKKLLNDQPETGKLLLSRTHQLYIDRGKWIITPQLIPNKVIYTIPEKRTPFLKTPHYTLQTKLLPRSSYQIQPNAHMAALDLNSLQFPLTIRKWQPGDYFYPLGMQTRKKVSDFLIDIKLPRPYKDQVDVLVSGDELVWVIGYRIDNRFKLQTQTQTVYEIQLFPNPSFMVYP